MGYKERLREASQDQTGHVQEGAASRGGWAGGMGSGGTAVSPRDRCCQVSDTAWGVLSSALPGQW